MRAILLVAAVASAHLACTGAGPDDPEVVGELVAGSSSADGTGFLSVADGTDVELVPGSQGGFHVWLGMSVRGIAGTLDIEREARRASDHALIYRGQRQRIVIPDEALTDWWDSPDATPAFMCPSPIGIRVFDEDLVFEVRILTEEDEILAQGWISLTPRCPTDDNEAFCRQICAG